MDYIDTLGDHVEIDVIVIVYFAYCIVIHYALGELQQISFSILVGSFFDAQKCLRGRRRVNAVTTVFRATTATRTTSRAIGTSVSCASTTICATDVTRIVMAAAVSMLSISTIIPCS